MKTNLFGKTICLMVLSNMMVALAGMLPLAPTLAAPSHTAISAAPLQAIYDCAAVTEIPQAECNALLALYDGTDGDNWNDNTGWLQTDTPCTWAGVNCTAGHVTRLYLISNNLSGSIPMQLSTLTNLTELNLGGNKLFGNIPAQLGKLTNLKWLYLFQNQLTGSIPTKLDNLKNLTELGLHDNQLSGSIPVELSSLTNLTKLYLSQNQLTGSIPPELSNLTNLTILALSFNQLTGRIPVELARLTNLEGLDLYQNQLTGNIPVELVSLTNLKGLSLSDNKLTGGIPPELGRLANLQSLGLSWNRLSGHIPSELGSLTNLSNLWLASNQLTGSIPPELSNLTKLEWLYLSENQLTGDIPSELGNLTNLRYLFLDGNQLTGSIPLQLGNLKKLHWLFLDSNQLTDSIPTELGNLTQLEELHLANNQLSGDFPISITNLVNLTSLTFDCALTSTDPAVTAFIYNLVPGWSGHCPIISGDAGEGGVMLRYTDGAPKTTTSAADGSYSLAVWPNWSGTVTPTKTGYIFAPASRTYNSIQTDQANQDYKLAITFTSTGAYDGWALESSEFSNKGGSLNATGKTFQLGDDVLNRQYKAILSFDTSKLPAGAVIQSVALRIRQSGVPIGSNPFITLGNLLVDIKTGAFGKPNLGLTDFQSLATAKKVGVFGKTPASGWYKVTLSAVSLGKINLTGVTQFRLYFSKDDNNNLQSDYLKFFSGNNLAYKPQLIITYTLP